MNRLHHSSHRGKRAGVSILEMLVATSVITLAVVAFTRAMIGSMKSSDHEEEVSRASNAARAALDELRLVAFDEVFVRYNEKTGDDPGTGASPGAAFDVEGLDPVESGARVGAIVFPTVTSGGTEELRENVGMPELGMPMDLNVDGVIDGDDRASDYRLLPVTVRVRWSGGTVEYRTILGG